MMKRKGGDKKREREIRRRWERKEKREIRSKIHLTTDKEEKRLRVKEQDRTSRGRGQDDRSKRGKES
jgi:hypothetical protein